MLQLSKASEFAVRLLELSASESPVADRMIKIRQLMEQLYKALTIDAKISFNGLFARMQYVNNPAGMSPELQMQCNKLRLLCNGIAHNEVLNPAPETLDTAILVMESLLNFFAPEFSSPELCEYLKQRKPKLFTSMPHSNKQSFLCIVDSWKLCKEGTAETALELNVVRDDGNLCRIILRNDTQNAGHDGRIYTKLAKSLWRYAGMHCHGLSEVAGQEGFYQSNPLTLIVLEPDFLVDASALAECFNKNTANPELFILSRIFSEASAESMLQGSVVNSIFDELVLGSSEDYLELFKHSLAALPIAMISLGKDTALRIYDKVKAEHLEQLKSFSSTLGTSEILLEPSYICPEYGLQGRLDLLSHQAEKYSIVELKSGKAHPNDVWLGHQMQVIAYNMIIRKAHGASRISNASILYSACKDKPLRHVTNTILWEQNLLMCRNRVLGIMHQLAEQPEVFFNWLKDCKEIPDPPFIQAKYNRFKALLNSIEPYEYEWFLAQVQRIVREIWFVKTGDNGSKSEGSYGYNALWQLGKTEKLAAYKIIADLQAVSFDKKLINFTIPPSDDIADFREGDIVVLYSQDASIVNQEILRGIISQLDGNQLQVSIRGGLQNNQRLGRTKAWAMEHDTLETSLYAPLSSITKFLTASPRLRRIIFGLENPEMDGVDTGLGNSDLASIISRMHKAKELFIVQGPPGTGKTSGLLGTYVSEVYKGSARKLLILSFTNRAVDEICLCLLRKEIPFLRVGNSGAIKEQLLSTQISGKRFEEMDGIIRENRIWVATVQSANAWYQDLLKIVKVDELIIDEASQIIENSILGIVSQSPKTILIGDQNQLPPICVQSPMPYQFSDPLLSELCYGSYHQSLMERLYRVHSKGSGQQALAMLRTHYRMHEDIADLISHNYANKLQSGQDSQMETLAFNPLLPDFLNQRLVWISCLPSNISHYDPQQVILISAIINKLISAGAIPTPESCLGIVAPFRAMIHALRKELAPSLKGITIDTVERFQGSERDNIIICLPLRHSSNLHQVESLSDDGLIDRKLNVALSRARQMVIIIGNQALCRNSQHYSTLIDSIARLGSVIDYQQAMKQLTE